MNFNRMSQVLFAVYVSSAAAHASVVVFNFDGDNLGAATTFTDIMNGVSATFSSNADPGGFVVLASSGMFQTLTGNVLGDPGPAQQDNLTLFVNFSSDLNAVDLNFATSDFITPSPVTLNAYQNSQLVGSAVATGQFLNGSFFPEGEIAFDGASFNSIRISSNAADFAVDNIMVNATPEPEMFPMVGLGLAFVAVGSVRARRHAGKTFQQVISE